MTDEDEDEDLVRAFLATGRVEDFEVLVERHRRPVFRIAIAVLGRGGESRAEDVTQDVFLQVYRRLHAFEYRSRFATWLYRIAYNRAIDQLRGQRARPEAPLPARTIATGASLRDPLRDGALADCIARLPDGQRAAVHMHYWLGHTSAEIAGLFGVQPGTAKIWLFRARHLLAQCLARKGVRS
jgi:RNA polymerase sigma-70 factor (ECF subfamily)